MNLTNREVVEKVLREYGTRKTDEICVLAHIRYGSFISKREVQAQLRALQKENIIARSDASGEAVFWLTENSI